MTAIRTMFTLVHVLHNYLIHSYSCTTLYALHHLLIAMLYSMHKSLLTLSHDNYIFCTMQIILAFHSSQLLDSYTVNEHYDSYKHIYSAKPYIILQTL